MALLAGSVVPAAPGAITEALRAARAAAAAQQDPAGLAEYGLRPLDGGRNNTVFAWEPAATADGTRDCTSCVKLYRRTDRRRVEREWHGLAHATRHGSRPAPLWIDQHPDYPALGMTLLSGAPILDILDPAQALAEVAAVTSALQSIPLDGPLAGLERVDSIGHYMARLTDIWPGQLADAADEPLTAQMQALLRRWHDGGDAALLAAPPETPVFSRGDANLLNWLHDSTTGQTMVVDFEFSGWSDLVLDAADHVEHLSAREMSDAVWDAALPAFGVTSSNRARFDAARRTTALRWLAVLWRQRTRRSEEFTAQHARVRALLD